MAQPLTGPLASIGHFSARQMAAILDTRVASIHKNRTRHGGDIPGWPPAVMIMNRLRWPAADVVEWLLLDEQTVANMLDAAGMLDTRRSAA